MHVQTKGHKMLGKLFLRLGGNKFWVDSPKDF